MTEEHIPARQPMAATALVEGFSEQMDKLLSVASVEAVFAKPIKNGNILIIPAAEVLGAMGMGFGYGSGRSAEGAEDNEGEGGGGGGGGRTFSRPVAVVVATPESVRVEPVIDLTKIALAALTAAGFMLGMLVKMTRPPKGK